MRYVDVLWTQLTRRRLCYGPQTELRAGEGRISRPTAKARCCAREEDIAFAAGQHQASCLPAGEKAGIAGHFPDLAEYAFGRVQNRKIDIGADVEDANFERRVFVRVAKEGNDFLLLARVERARVNFAAGLLDLLDERLELGAVAAPGEHRKAFGGELLCNFTADKVASTDHGHGRVSLLQGYSPGQVRSVVCEVERPAPEALPRTGTRRVCA